ncbi:FAD-dependent oxidoreductase [candidate division WOR-3 bacterium]|nr:FAD-dependent oxidoreductase [candidate division WOR-3 bacterium]
MDEHKTIGAALVVGGGVGGMQAALDLAESGIKVYLVESKPCIGGVMAQLDKTFPTNDCAMCTLAPRLVEVGRHKDIEILTLTDVEAVQGEPGNFTVTVKRRARYIREDKCNGCGECAEKCPIETRDMFNANLTKQKAIYRLYPQAIPNIFAIQKLGQAPCRFACPAGQRVEGYVALIRQKRYEEAYHVIRRDNPFPSVCGRICNHRCEDECTRKKVDEAIPIMSLKRFVADWAYDNKVKITKPDNGSQPASGKRVAVVGAGPGGLTAACDLKEMGHGVVVYEVLPEPGGMMRYGVPDFRMDLERLQWDIGNLLEGIELKTDQRVDNVSQLLQTGFDAVFVAIGAHLGKKLNIPGKDLPDVLLSTEFLRAAAMKQPVTLGKRVLVLGGGNVAMDVARTALRLGAEKVEVSCLESRDKMPAHSWEIEDAEKEGITMYPGRTFHEIVSEAGAVQGVRCTEIDFHGFDAAGRPVMDLKPGTEHVLAADTVIFAIGQKPDGSCLDGEIELTAAGTIKVDPDTLMTSKPGIFAAGDVVTGTQFVVDAVAAGHHAAASIDRYLRGLPMPPVPARIKVALSYAEIKERLKSDGKPPLPRSSACGAGLSEEQALYEASRCLECGICAECLLCADACKANAIDHLMEPEAVRELNVGAVVLAPGYDLFDVSTKLELNYALSPNVVTALEFERILSASGPYSGEVRRPSDGQAPKRIAFIQCVGSRDDEHNYCSSICCMYATKEAIIAMEHSPGLECTIFYIDLRAYGKGFDEYYERAQQLGVRYLRCRPSAVDVRPGTNDLVIQYQAADGSIQAEEFGMVVLSTGLRPSAASVDLAQRLDIDLNQFKYCATGVFSPLATNRPGIYTCGPFTEPKDIPETVTQASAASGNALAILAPARNTLIVKREYPPEIDVQGQEPRIGVFVCHCGRNIGGVVDVPAVVEYAKSQPNVVYAECNLYTCSTDTQEKIKSAIGEHALNRIIVASCTPRTHEPLFRQTIREAGLNQYLFEMANIRDQCSWVHMHEPEAATRKARDLVRMATAKARLIEPLQRRLLPVEHSALVIGGGLSGMMAALGLGDQGIEVAIVEQESELGGHARHIHYLLDAEDPQERLSDIVERVKNHPMIRVYTSSEITHIEGFVGNFKTVVRRSDPGIDVEIEHGAIIVATGAAEYQPTEYLYGQDQRVLTQRELEERIAQGGTNIAKLKSIVMIQCVGSRDEKNPYCNRICCSTAIKNALRLKRIDPAIEIFIIYRDMRTYGFKEAYYTEARLAGVKFIRYEPDNKPIVSASDAGLTVSVADPILGSTLNIECDLVVLSAAIVPREDSGKLAQLLKVPLNQNGFFLEAHMKLRPIDFATDGIFLCGLAHAPKLIDESIAQATGCASRATTVLSKEHIELEATISEVIDANCDGCAYCIDPCPYKALTLIEYMRNGDVKKTVETNEALCKGCGVCQATCPKKGIFVRNFRLEQLAAMVDAALVG